MKSILHFVSQCCVLATLAPTAWAQTLDLPQQTALPAIEKGAYWNAIECLNADRSGIDTYAENLLKLKSSSENGALGWPYKDNKNKSGKCHAANSIDAFSDGTCNPPATPYMIQTGYAIACLSRAYLLTRDRRYLETAQRATEDSWDLGVSNKTCEGSHNYWFSYSANDTGRFVRNTNAIMGTGLLWLYRATNDPKYRHRAAAIAQAEKCELAAGNFGYLGIADPQYRKNPNSESRRIENHIPHQVKFLEMASVDLKDKESMLAAQQLLSAFLGCKEDQCTPNNCAAWAVSFNCPQPQRLAHCMLPQSPSFSAKNCEQAKTGSKELRGVAKYLTLPPTQ